MCVCVCIVEAIRLKLKYSPPPKQHCIQQLTAISNKIEIEIEITTIKKKKKQQMDACKMQCILENMDDGLAVGMVRQVEEY